MNDKIKLSNKSDEMFQRYCQKAKVEPTSRQYHKWERQEGEAYNLARNDAPRHKKVRYYLRDRFGVRL